MATTENSTIIKNPLRNTDGIEWFYKRTNQHKIEFLHADKRSIFADLHKEHPMGCEVAVLHEPLRKNLKIKQLAFERNIRQPYIYTFCLFGVSGSHIHGNEGLEDETSELFNLFLEKTGGTEPANFRGVCMEDIAPVEDNIQVDVFLYDNNIINGSMIGELARISIRKSSNTV